MYSISNIFLFVFYIVFMFVVLVLLTSLIIFMLIDSTEIGKSIAYAIKTWANHYREELKNEKNNL